MVRLDPAGVLHELHMGLWNVYRQRVRRIKSRRTARRVGSRSQQEVRDRRLRNTPRNYCFAGRPTLFIYLLCSCTLSECCVSIFVSDVRKFRLTNLFRCFDMSLQVIAYNTLWDFRFFLR